MLALINLIIRRPATRIQDAARLALFLAPCPPPPPRFDPGLGSPAWPGAPRWAGQAAAWRCGAPGRSRDPRPPTQLEFRPGRAASPGARVRPAAPARQPLRQKARGPLAPSPAWRPWGPCVRDLATPSAGPHASGWAWPPACRPGRPRQPLPGGVRGRGASGLRPCRPASPGRGPGWPGAPAPPAHWTWRLSRCLQPSPPSR